MKHKPGTLAWCGQRIKDLEQINDKLRLRNSVTLNALKIAQSYLFVECEAPLLGGEKEAVLDNVFNAIKQAESAV